MGEITQELYKPEDINWEARRMVEAYSERPTTVILSVPRKSKLELYAGIFCLIAAAGAVMTFLYLWG